MTVGNPLELSSQNLFAIYMIIMIVATAGSLMQISGTSWDVTSHLMSKPETFFTPSHSLLYSGIGLIIIATTFITILYFKHKEIFKKVFPLTSFRLLLIGSGLCILSGPADYLWHQTFGIDGLLSPTHISLMTGMLITSLGVVIGLARIKIASLQVNKTLERIRKVTLLVAFAALWFTITWYVFFFALPFSNGANLNFNLNPILSSVIASVFLPLVSSNFFFIISKTFRKFGAASITAGIVIVINILANIMSTDGILFSSISWYLPIALLPVILADFLINNARFKVNKKEMQSLKKIFAAVLIGGGFYIFNYPMILWAYAIPLEMSLITDNQKIPSMSELLLEFGATLRIMLIISVISGSLFGVIGYLLSSKIMKSQNIAREDNSTQEYSLRIKTD